MPAAFTGQPPPPSFRSSDYRAQRYPEHTLWHTRANEQLVLTHDFRNSSVGGSVSRRNWQLLLMRHEFGTKKPNPRFTVVLVARLVMAPFFPSQVFPR